MSGFDDQYSLVNFLFFLFFYSRCLRAQSFVKAGVRAPCALWSRRHFRGTVSHQKTHYKTAIQSECTVSQGLFSQCLRSKLCSE